MSRFLERVRRRRSAGILALAAGLSLAAGWTPHGAAAAGYRLQLLHLFCARGLTLCPEGGGPSSGLVMDAAGNLYGETFDGGQGRRCRGFGCGVAFELTPDKSRATGWSEAVLYRFCPEGEPCLDGAKPEGGLITDAAGKLYGTAGGNASRSQPLGPGLVFALTPNPSRTAWGESVLYRFCAQGLPCPDGANPETGLIADADGNLYGTTAAGGGAGNGVVFALRHNASRTEWTETVLYSFCARTCIDGAFPQGGLIMDASGNLYGTTYNGGAAIGPGTVFELTPNADRSQWTETVLYSFCMQSPTCADGANPFGSLIMDTAGNLYGETAFGGRAKNAGVVFALTHNADRSRWSETVLNEFACGKGGRCGEGSPIPSGLVMDSAGHLFGIDYGINGIIELTPNATRTAWTATVLQRFCPLAGMCPDGDAPVGLILDGSGNLYGTTALGGVKRNGVAFELVKQP
jgi:uncharacterized repeat protein (TIGR03803 family)